MNTFQVLKSNSSTVTVCICILVLDIWLAVQRGRRNRGSATENVAIGLVRNGFCCFPGCIWVTLRSLTAEYNVNTLTVLYGLQCLYQIVDKLELIGFEPQSLICCFRIVGGKGTQFVAMTVTSSKKCQPRIIMLYSYIKFDNYKPLRGCQPSIFYLNFV